MPKIKHGLLGIDVSRYQASADGKKRFDWKKAKPYIYFAGIRATVGAAGLDYQYYYNIQEAAAEGIPFFPYHVPKLDKNIDKQIDAFADACIGPDGKYIGQLPPMMDSEAFPEDMSKSEVANRLTKIHFGFIDEMANRGVEMPWLDKSVLFPMEYGNAYQWNTRKERLDWPKLYPFMVAHYPWDVIKGVDNFPTVAVIRKDNKRPILPDDLYDINNPVEELIWQFSGRNGVGKLLGSEGDDDIDLDLFNGTLEEFNAMFGLSMTERLPFPEGQPEPPPPPGEPELCEEILNGTIQGTLNLRTEPVAEGRTLRGMLKAGDKVKVIGRPINNYWPVVMYVYDNYRIKVEK